MNSFSPKTIKALGSYVYVYSDPDTGKPFYVGKGTGNRAFHHLNDSAESEKVRKIQEILRRGKQPVIEILAHGLDQQTALKIEAAAIDLIGIENLTNKQHGHGSSLYGKIEVSMLDTRYSHGVLNQADITDNVILIRINRLYRNGMSAFELYEATRGYWRVNLTQVNKVKYVLSVYDGMVIEVYRVQAWLPAEATLMLRTESEAQSDELQKKADHNTSEMTRYEFVGKIADAAIRAKYVDKDVSQLFTKGEINPIKYIFGEKTVIE